LKLGLIILVPRTSLDFGHRDSSQESTYSNYYILILANSFIFNITLRITGGDAYFALYNLLHESAAFSVWTPNSLNIIKVYYSPTNAQDTVLKNNIKIYIKITPTCFGAVTPSSGSSLSVLAKVTLC